MRFINGTVCVRECPLSPPDSHLFVFVSDFKLFLERAKKTATGQLHNALISFSPWAWQSLPA